MNKSIALVILAAGSSSRMGQPKQLLPWDNTTLLGYSIQQALACNAEQVYVVLGAYAAQIYPEINQFNAIQVIENKNWIEGMGSSIALAVHHIQKQKKYDAVLIMLADQPKLDFLYLNRLIEKYKTDSQLIIATSYDRKDGVPALFDAHYFDELAQLSGDKGAKKVIVSYPKKVVSIQVSRDCLIDVDTQDVYQKLLSQE